MDTEHDRRIAPRIALNLRIGGSLASALVRIAQREHNSVSSVARRLISQSLECEQQANPQEAMDSHA